MSSSTDTGETKDLNLYFCVLFVAKLKPNERLVEKPTSHNRVFTCIQEWPSYAYLEYFESWLKIKTFTAQKLKDKGVSWQTVFKWCKDAIHRVIYRNRSQIFEPKRDC